MKAGVITAMESEQKQLADKLDNKSEIKGDVFNYITGSKGGNEIVLMQCGWGKVNAAAGSVEMIRNFNPDCIISTGCAGGIDDCLDIMDVVVGRQTVYHDVWCGKGDYGQIYGLPTYYECNATLYNCAMNLDAETKIRGGLICTGDKFVSDRDELDAIKSRFRAGSAVDMESCAIAQVCHLYHVPFISFRIISDTPYRDKNFEQFLNFWQEMADRSFKVTENFLESLPDKL